MGKNLMAAVLSENEFVIRSYQCTILRPLFMKPSIGFLSITNKRVVYHSESNKAGNANAIISEIPIYDVSGISTYIGRSFNFLGFLLFSAAIYFLTMFLSGFLPEFFTGWAFSIILLIPYGIGFLFEKNILNQDIKRKILENLENTPVENLVQNKDTGILMPILRVLFLIGASLLGYNFVKDPSFVGFVGFAVLIAIYLLVFEMLFGQKRSFGLKVNSKGSGSSGLYIRGGAFGQSRNPGEAITANPAVDAETIAAELGALVLDIQQMGDFAAQKWGKSEN